ncbi:MAG: DsrE family protein [Peptostreptococcaceae bacterium]|nr:DsrE family protein [Peptostreptococcaceae bacterium]
MEKLNVLWTTADKATVINMLSMYTVNALKNGWFDEVNIVIWGGSAKLVAEDTEMQKLVKKMIESGITIEACKACADKYNASDIMIGLGVDVKYMGKPLTSYIKSDDYMITI